MTEAAPVSSVISASYVDMGKFVFADLPDLLMAALSKACAASSSVSWSPKDTVRLWAEICTNMYCIYVFCYCNARSLNGMFDRQAAHDVSSVGMAKEQQGQLLYNMHFTEPKAFSSCMVWRTCARHLPVGLKSVTPR